MRSVRLSVRSSVILPLVVVVFVSVTTFLTLTHVSGASSDGEQSSSAVIAAPEVSPAPNYGGIIFGRGFFNSVGMFKINTDGTNRISLTDLGSVQAKNYSVSRDTGMIAFQMPSGDHGSKIFVMNWDGTGVRQVSPGTDPSDTTSDFNPSISPDGTKVAFASTRRRGEPVATCTDGALLVRDYEIWMVNTDGTNFHQATFSEDHMAAYGGQGDGCGMGSSTRAAWMADNQHLVVYGTRPYKPQSGDTRLIFPGSLEAWSSTGRFGTLYGVNPDSDPVNKGETADDSRKQAVGAVGLSGSASGLGWLDVDPNNRVLFQAGCCFIPDADGLGFWTPGTLGVSYANRDAVMGRTQADGTGQIFRAQYSPDGSHWAIYGTSPFFSNNHQSTIFVDGYQSPIPGLNDFSQSDYGLAWAPGPPIPNPAKLILQPNPLWLYNGVRSPVSPSLLDADGNVIARSAAWSISDVYSSVGFRCDNTSDQIVCSGTQLNGLRVDFTGAVLGGGSNAEGNLCEANAGIRTCIPYYNTAGSAFLSVSATQPVALTSGAGGPGKFTISRVGTPPTLDLLVVNFSVGGSAVRDVDYTLDFSGNLIIMPAGQASVDITVRPLRTQVLDKSVVLTLQPTNGVYSIVDASATVTIKDGPNPTPTPTPSITPTPSPTPSLTLTNISPNHGGDQGVVTTTIYGQGVQPGATVKLVRSGQIDIIGQRVQVGAAGSYVSTVFDLSGQMQGTWDVVVSNPDSSSANLPNAFTIEAARDSEIWVDIIGASLVSIRGEHTYYFLYGNRGNRDTGGVPVIRGIPPGATWKIDLPEPPIVNGVPVAWDELPLSFDTGQETVIPLPTTVLAPDQTMIVRVRIIFPVENAPFELGAMWMEGP